MHKVTYKDLDIFSSILMAMYTEVEPLASTNIDDYKKLAISHITNDYPFMFEDKAMFIMRDVSSPVIDKKIWDGVSVYIKPEYRNTNILKTMYDYMFNNFEGIIIGYVDANSIHEKVVQKRYKKLGSIYEINRPIK